MRRRDFAHLVAAPLVLRASAASIPPKTVVLTFDDAVKSHRTFVGPLLAELGFRATFFVTHGWMTDKANFMSWSEIAELHRMGFEIGNHSWTHGDFSTPRGAARLEGELALVNYELDRVKVPRPTSFAWCGNTFGPEALEMLRNAGITLARRGGAPEVEYGKIVLGPLYDPTRHHPLLIPTTADAYPDWTFDHFTRVVSEAREGRIVVLQFHGVPDTAHAWVHTPPESFRRYMEHLKTEGYTTLALRDVVPFQPATTPADPMLAVRYRAPKDGKLALPPEREATLADLEFWRTNMREHGFSATEASAVTGLSEKTERPIRVRGPKISPYPGGRHPRLGFREGQVSPMRGTKASVFLPWDDAGYLVIDLPEAIFAEGKLIFLGHTHLPTVWDEQNIVIPNRDWTRKADGALESEWLLPDKIAFGAGLTLSAGEVRMSLWVRNGSDRPLREMRSQVCVMLGRAGEFSGQTNANKTLTAPRATVRSRNGRWLIHAEWDDCQRVWGNEKCPCMHSDPRLPDCAPGQAVRSTGRMWFEEA